MSGHLDPLEPDIASVLDAAKELDPLPPATSDRVMASLAARIAALPPDGGGGAQNGNGSAAASRPSASWLRGRSALIGAVSFGFGVAVGVGARRPPTAVERIVYVDRPVPLAAPAEPPSSWMTVPVDSLPRAGSAPSASTSTAASGDGLRPSTASTSSHDQLAAESALLDLARVAVAQGEGDRALEAVERHRTQFPNGILAEERDALAIKALHLVGRDAEARTRASRFERTYPKSLFLPALHGILDGAP
jgi:hypothetical protein